MDFNVLGWATEHLDLYTAMVSVLSFVLGGLALMIVRFGK